MPDVLEGPKVLVLEVPKVLVLEVLECRGSGPIAAGTSPAAAGAF